MLKNRLPNCSEKKEKKKEKKKEQKRKEKGAKEQKCKSRNKSLLVKKFAVKAVLNDILYLRDMKLKCYISYISGLKILSYFQRPAIFLCVENAEIQN